MAKSFHTSVENRMDHIWITFKDSVDMDNYKKVEDSIFLQLKKENIQDIVVDLSETSTLFSPGIGVIMRIHNFAKQNNRKLFIVNVSEKLNEVLIFSSLDRILKIYPSEKEFSADLK